MIGLLEPALLLPRQGPRAEAELQRDLSFVVNACRHHNVRLLPLEGYWRLLWGTLGQQLERTLSPEGKRALQAVRNLGNVNFSSSQPAPVTVWRRGFHELFNENVLPSDWEHIMAATVARAVTMNEDVIVFVRRIEGRNARTHRVNQSTLTENTRWVLHVQPPGIGPCRVLCIHHLRNLREKWTTRYDWRLPGEGDQARYPFCPPHDWWKPLRAAWSTVSSKYAWIDKRENGWARPNIQGGAGYHWDVYIRDSANLAAVGVEQINVVQFGAPESEGRCGYLHHIPRDLQNRVSDSGWGCE